MNNHAWDAVVLLLVVETFGCMVGFWLGAVLFKLEANSIAFKFWKVTTIAVGLLLIYVALRYLR